VRASRERQLSASFPKSSFPSQPPQFVGGPRISQSVFDQSSTVFSVTFRNAWRTRRLRSVHAGPRLIQPRNPSVVMRVGLILVIAVSASLVGCGGPTSSSSSPVSSSTPLRTPAPTIPSWLVDFVYAYAETRTKYAGQLARVSPPVPSTTAQNIRYHAERGALHHLARLDFEKLRPTPARELADAAIAATQTALQVELDLGAAYQYRGGPSVEEQSRATTLRAEAERMWRLLDDRIEGLLAPYGGAWFWPGGVRPPVPI
jgi:hypothetical protein